MKAMQTTCALAVFASAILLPIRVATADEKQGPPPPPEPTKYHKMLAKDAGVWTAEMKVYMGGPDAPPMVMQAKETNTLMAGGLWLLSDFESGPFRGHAQMGYDTIKKKFVGTWIENGSTHMSTMEGTLEKSGKVVCILKGIDHETQKPATFKTITTFKDDDNKVFTMLKKEKTGKWVKVFDMFYKRQK